MVSAMTSSSAMPVSAICRSTIELVGAKALAAGAKAVSTPRGPRGLCSS